MDKSIQKGGSVYIQGLVNAAVKSGRRCATVHGGWEIDEAIRLPSNFTLILEDCHLRLADGCYSNIFINEHNETEIGKTTGGTDRNISILGRGEAILDGGTYNGLGEMIPMAERPAPLYKNNLILFTNVDGFKISGLRCINQRWWATNFIYCRNGYIGDMDFCSDDRRYDENGNLVYDEFSLLGSTYDTTKGYGDKDSYMEMGSVLSKNAAFIANLEKVKYYESEGYLTADESALADGKVSFACIKGGADIPDIYAENYEAVVVGTPTFTAEDVYRDMFAVTSYSNVKRSMEIVTLLNTDEEFRNLILYGIEKGFEIELDRKVFDANGNPVLDEKGVQKKTTITVPANYEKVIYEDPTTGHEYTAIRRLNKNYMMSPEKTGNQLLVYGVVNKDNVKEIEFLIKKDYAIIQNNDVVVNPILGFTPGYGKNPYNADTMKLIREASAEVLVKLNAMDYSTFISENGIAALRTEYDSVIKLVAATGTPDDHSDENYKPFAYGYYKWAKELGIAPEIIGLD